MDFGQRRDCICIVKYHYMVGNVGFAAPNQHKSYKMWSLPPLRFCLLLIIVAHRHLQHHVHVRNLRAAGEELN